MPLCPENFQFSVNEGFLPLKVIWEALCFTGGQAGLNIGGPARLLESKLTLDSYGSISFGLVFLRPIWTIGPCWGHQTLFSPEGRFLINLRENKYI